eukprot:scaffold4372_cov397-Prasinococcus_capsulatus_cf.AAC.53
MYPGSRSALASMGPEGLGSASGSERADFTESLRARLDERVRSTGFSTRTIAGMEAFYYYYSRG